MNGEKLGQRERACGLPSQKTTSEVGEAFSPELVDDGHELGAEATLLEGLSRPGAIIAADLDVQFPPKCMHLGGGEVALLEGLMQE